MRKEFTYTESRIIKYKDDFILKSEKAAQMYELFIKQYELFFDTIKKFDGKVLNKRLETALKPLMQCEHSYVSITATRVQISFNGRERELYKDGTFCGYLSTYSTTFDVLIDNDYRIKAEDTIAQMWLHIETYKKNVAVYKDCIANFDKYAEKSMQFELLANQYKKEVPYLLQLNFSLSEPSFY